MSPAFLVFLPGQDSRQGGAECEMCLVLELSSNRQSAGLSFVEGWDPYLVDPGGHVQVFHEFH